jgi:hypothetical protein
LFSIFTAHAPGHGRVAHILLAEVGEAIALIQLDKSAFASMNGYLSWLQAVMIADHIRFI